MSISVGAAEGYGEMNEGWKKETKTHFSKFYFPPKEHFPDPISRNPREIF